MKTLILVRHAKSSWKFPDLKDIERPLRKKGVRDARLMASVLMNMHTDVDHIMTSPAERATETAKSFAEEFGLSAENISVRENLYLESKTRMLNEIMSLDDGLNSVILVSHEPAISDLANLLTEESVENIPTTGMVGIQFDVSSWREIEGKKGKRLFFEVPKNHRKKDIEKDKAKVL